MEFSHDNRQFSFKDGNLALSKYHSAVQVFYIKSLVFNSKALHHEGVMLVCENKEHNRSNPTYIFPFWDPENEALEKLEILEKQLKKSTLSGNILSLEVNFKPKGKGGNKKLITVLENELLSESDKKDNFFASDDTDTLCSFLPPNIRPKKITDAGKVDIPILLEPTEEKVEDSHLVKQYVKLIAGWNTWKFEGFDDWKDANPVKRFRKILDRNGGHMHSFLKIQLGFTDQNRLAKILINYIKTHKCNIENCSNFSKVKCSKCKTAIYCSVECQRKDFENHSKGECEKLKKHYINRVEAFRKMITDIVYSKMKISDNDQGNLSLDDFCSRIKPWALSGYHDYIVKKTFLLGFVKFSSEKFSNIDISERSEKLKPLLKYGAEKFDESNRPNYASDLYENMGRAWFFEELTLMKSLYTARQLDTAKISSGKWRKDFDAKDKDYKSQFIDEDHHALKEKMIQSAMRQKYEGPDVELIRQNPNFGRDGFSMELIEVELPI